MSCDTERLADNQQSLLQAMHQMVLLMHRDGTVEYMNPSAIDFFGDLRNNKADTLQIRRIRSQLRSLLKKRSPKTGSRTGSATIKNCQIEYNIAPFTGYSGELLFWLIIKNLTEEYKSRQELRQLHHDIESILVEKTGGAGQDKTTDDAHTPEAEAILERLDHHPSHGVMVGASSTMHKLRDMVLQIAKTDTTVLITGESGTGKELFVNLIHETSNRRDKPLLKINCTAINDSLLESDLFGYEKGAFTGAHGQKKGKFEVVDGGTLFLDEIGDISPHMQAVLLRVLQDGEFIRVGGNRPIKADVRIIAATNVDLVDAVQRGAFRLDLFYRLSIFNLAIPPLRERREDIPALATHFVRKYSSIFEKNITVISEPFIRTLVRHDWPGNVRELENVIQRAVLMCKTSTLTAQDIIFDNAKPFSSQQASLSSIIEKYNGTSLKNIIAEFEREVLVHKLRKHDGNVTLLADTLAIGKTALYDKMKRYDISLKDLR
ncbi:sigma-54 dependent transcriptional regulator [bacterium]|nr:sigma-54 dependent transcriptional regulator [bacterium]